MSTISNTSLSAGTSNESLEEIAVSVADPDISPKPSNSQARSPLRNSQIAPEAIRALPAEFVKRNRILPLELRNGSIRIATAEPGNQRVIDDIRLFTGLEVEETAAPSTEILERIAECYQITVEQMVENLTSEHVAAGETRNLHDIEVMANEPTVINLVNVIISAAVRERASDIHLVPFENALQLRYRIDGLLQEKPPPPKNLHAAIVSRVKIMADMNIAERYMPQDGHIQIHHRGARVDIRVGTMPTIHGESLVMRLLEKSNRVLGLEELGLDKQRAETLWRMVEKPHGLFLATGPTGSGKTTTLYSVLNGIYSPEKKILTIEDPVEYELTGVAQTPVRPSRGFTFATGLRSILRQDPDVVMVGEIRDGETAEIAIRAALTGHQVFSTLHTNDASGAITRLIDMGVEAFLISSSLVGVLAQRLVRRLCPKCRVESPLTHALAERIAEFGVAKTDGPFYRGSGCEECRGTGYKGRVGIFELLPVTADLRELILQRRSSGQIKAAARETILTMQQDAVQKALAGMTSIEEILRVCSGE
ncbi:MAG TPA: GspE/PulE family protein [Verrucomicrobiae bacterium]|nr:GspE/PulE family protein [Verrucomicrobiae bacterium]